MYEIHSPNALTMPARHDDSETNCGNGALLDLGKGERRAHGIQPAGQSKHCSGNPANKEKILLVWGYSLLVYISSLKVFLQGSSIKIDAARIKAA